MSATAVKQQEQPVNYIEVIKDIEEFYSENSVQVYCKYSAKVF